MSHCKYQIEQLVPLCHPMHHWCRRIIMVKKYIALALCSWVSGRNSINQTIKYHLKSHFVGHKPAECRYYRTIPSRTLNPIRYLNLISWGCTIALGKSPLLDCRSHMAWVVQQGPVSISDKASYCKISQSLEAARFVFRIVRSIWNLTGTSAGGLPKCLSNFKTMR